MTEQVTWLGGVAASEAVKTTVMSTDASSPTYGNCVVLLTGTPPTDATTLSEALSLSVACTTGNVSTPLARVA